MIPGDSWRSSLTFLTRDYIIVCVCVCVCTAERDTLNVMCTRDFFFNTDWMAKKFYMRTWCVSARQNWNTRVARANHCSVGGVDSIYSPSHLQRSCRISAVQKILLRSRTHYRPRALVHGTIYANLTRLKTGPKGRELFQRRTTCCTRDVLR